MCSSLPDRLPALLNRCLAFGLGALLLAAATSEAATPILMVHSYSQEYDWTRGQHDDFVAALKADPGVNLAFSTEYLDTKRRSYDAAYAQAMADHLRIKYAGYQPAAIYVSDDNALLFARDHLRHLFPAVPIFFSGVNDYAVGQSLDPHRFTGVFEKKEIAPNLDWLLRLDPGLRTLVFVGDGSNTHAAVEQEIRKDLAGYPRLQARFIGEKRLDRMLERLRGEPSPTLFLTTLGGMTDAGGEVLQLPDTLRALSQGGRRVISMEDAYVRDGVLGGFVTHGARQGAEAARLLLEHLHGKPLAEIPQVLKSPNAYLFDDAVLEARKLSLPEDIVKQATLLNPRMAFIDTHRTLIVGVLYGLTAALVLAILAALFIVLRKNRELMLAHAAAEKSEARNQQIMANAPEAMLIVDADGRIQTLNHRAEILFGYAPEELLGQLMEVLLPDHLRERHRHVHRAAYARHPVTKPMSTGRELAGRRKDGNSLPVEISLAPLESDADLEVIVMIRDLTEHRRLAALLADRSAQLEALFLLSPDGLVTADQEGSVISVNSAFLRMTGLLATDIVGRSLAELERLLRELAENPEQWAGLDVCFAGQESRVGAGDAAQRERTTRHLLALKRPRDAVLDLVGITSNASPVSQLLYVRDATREMEVDRLKSEFLSHAAHELRTPMASIFGFTELLMSQEFDAPTRKDLLATIHKQTQWLVDIINELLDLSRIEARRGKDFRIEAVPLAALVGETVAAMNIDPTRWPLVVHIPDGLPAVRTDAAKLRQALTNVLSNAVKYSPGGGAIDIRCGAKEMDGKTFVDIAVADHGIGMTPQQAARVGERFYRADTSGNIPGTGLGMAIVKEVIELLGGGVSITCPPRAGATVTLWLPAARVGDRAPADARLPSSPFNSSQEPS